MKKGLGHTSAGRNSKSLMMCNSDYPDFHSAFSLNLYLIRSELINIDAYQNQSKRDMQRNPGVLRLSLSPGIVQGTRGLMLASILLSFISILVEVVGMRCTTCMAQEPEQKDKVALAGGVIFLIAGQCPLSGRGWGGGMVDYNALSMIWLVINP